jgi:hypothetical protein
MTQRQERWRGGVAIVSRPSIFALQHIARIAGWRRSKSRGFRPFP